MAVMEELQEISMEGFRVVSVDMFSRHTWTVVPMITLWSSHIAFSKAAVNALNNCERIRMEVNAQSKKILLVPVSTKDKDGIRWMTTGKTPHGRKIECHAFAEKLYESWGWDKDMVYRAKGRIVTSDSKVLLLFDFTSAECWPLGDKTKVRDA